MSSELIRHDFPPDKEREVRISGASDCVDLAEKMVTRIIDNGDNKGIQQVIQRVLGWGGRHDRDRYDSRREHDYPEHYRMSSEASEPRSPEPDRHTKRSSEKGNRSQPRWAHDKYSDDDGTSRSAGSTPPRKRR
ncbi:hypothetical protein DUNSADRAFT_6598 [Dunaliella salina]|uniref:Uncharacterized protein n=1 Tax=Dunaliella salina TaxID=3046 RepID=A0ABQ7GMZ9_DUNSA|nr:hypothetical protein DUNSADRAFT_6598 [Dunaliella salina]|eukprot:KAF5835982.1 hypothetical protein DUNSADRAFT_6598 [Dunaliella salina]